MAKTQVRSANIEDGGVARSDLNTSLAGSAVIAKAVQGSGISLSSSGVDAGTGDVTIALDVRVYVATLIQSGAGDPVATVIRNTLGGTVVWARTAMGNYQATLSGAFTANKTALYVTPGEIDLNSNGGILQFGWQSADSVLLIAKTVSLTFGSSFIVADMNNLSPVTVKIEVYP